MKKKKNLDTGLRRGRFFCRVGRYSGSGSITVSTPAFVLVISILNSEHLPPAVYSFPAARSPPPPFCTEAVRPWEGPSPSPPLSLDVMAQNQKGNNIDCSSPTHLPLWGGPRVGVPSAACRSRKHAVRWGLTGRPPVLKPKPGPLLTNACALSPFEAEEASADTSAGCRNRPAEGSKASF